MTLPPETTPLTRRLALAWGGAFTLWPLAAWPQTAEIWSARQADEALTKGDLVLLDIRSRREWKSTGLAKGAWPISLHEDRFLERLQTAMQLAGERRLALICATGGRSAYVQRALASAGAPPVIDISEGMLGSPAGPGWIRTGLPVVPLEEALAALPDALREG